MAQQKQTFIKRLTDAVKLLVETLGLGTQTTVRLTIAVVLFATGAAWFSTESLFRLFNRGHAEWSLEKRGYRTASVAYSLLLNTKRVHSRLKGVSFNDRGQSNELTGGTQQLLDQIVREEPVSFAVLLDRKNNVVTGRSRFTIDKRSHLKPARVVYGLPGTSKTKSSRRVLSPSPRLGAFPDPMEGFTLYEGNAKTGCSLSNLPILNRGSTYGYELITREDAICLGIDAQLPKEGAQAQPGLILVAVEPFRKGKLISGLLLNNFSELAKYWQEYFGTSKVTIFVDKKPVLTNMLKGDQSLNFTRTMNARTYDEILKEGSPGVLNGIEIDGLTYGEIYLPLFRDASKNYGYEVLAVLAVANGEWLKRDLEEVHTNLLINGAISLLVVFIVLIPFNRLVSSQESDLRKKQLVLEISNQTNESILASLREGILGFDIDGCVVFSNNSARRLLNHEFLNTSYLGAYIQSVEDKKELFDSLFMNKFTTKQVMLKRIDGTTFQGEYTTFRIQGISSVIFGFSFFDISERLELEEKRRKAATMETQYQLLGEVHEVLVGNVSDALRKIRLAKERLLSDIELAYGDLVDAEKLCTTCLTETRKLIRMTKETEPVRAISIAKVCDEVEAALKKCSSASINTHFGKSISIREVDSVIAETLVRLVQQALDNTIIHSQARNVYVTLEVADLSICLIVEDDGIGADQELLSSSDGFGLSSMGRRADRIGGKFEITTSKGQGMKVSFNLELHPRISRSNETNHEQN